MIKILSFIRRWIVERQEKKAISTTREVAIEKLRELHHKMQPKIK